MLITLANWSNKSQQKLIDELAHPGQPVRLRPHLDHQGSAREGRRRRSPQGRRGPRNGHARTSWLTQDSLCDYGHIWIIKEALEKACVADRRKVAEARAMDTREGPAQYFAGGHLKFDDKGRRVDAPLVIIQWQNGEPVTVYPPEDATAKAIWAAGSSRSMTMASHSSGRTTASTDPSASRRTLDPTQKRKHHPLDPRGHRQVADFRSERWRASSESAAGSLYPWVRTADRRNEGEPPPEPRPRPSAPRPSAKSEEPDRDELW